MCLGNSEWGGAGGLNQGWFVYVEHSFLDKTCLPVSKTTLYFWSSESDFRVGLGNRLVYAQYKESILRSTMQTPNSWCIWLISRSCQIQIQTNHLFSIRSGVYLRNTLQRLWFILRRFDLLGSEQHLRQSSLHWHHEDGSATSWPDNEKKKKEQA